MSGLLLCSGEEARTPYPVRELGVSLHSREELAYYIYNYVFLLENEFINEQLLSFIGKELKNPKLEEKIRKWAADRFDLGRILMMMLQDLHYHDEAELESFKEKVDWLRQAYSSERRKKRADYMLGCRRYAVAISLYDGILGGDEDAGMTREMLGKIHHNRAIALVGLFEYEKAMTAFARSYEILKKPVILKELFFAVLLSGRKEIPEPLVKETTSEDLLRWKEEYEKAYEMLEEKTEEIEVLMDKDSLRRKAGMQELIGRWKKEYREMAKS